MIAFLPAYHSVINTMEINLSEEKKQALLGELTSLYHSEFDEELSGFRAEQIIDFFIQALGPAIYNQAIQDARVFVTEKLEDLDAEFYIDDSFDV